MKPFLECQGLTKKFKHFTLGPLDLTLEEGWFYALVGPNGAGKTTFLRTLLTLSIPTEGSLRLWGLEPLQHEVEVKARLGFVLDGQFDQVMTTWQEVGKFHSRVYRDWDNELYQRLVKRLNLETKTKVNKFSKGNRNALALVCALSHRPDLLVVDEPTAGLDPAARVEVFDLLHEHREQEGRTILFSTHLLDEVESQADQVLFMAGGQFREQGSPDDLRSKYHLVKTPDSSPSLIGARKRGTTTVGLVTDPQPWSNRPDTVVERPSLDDVFVHLIRGERDHE